MSLVIRLAEYIAGHTDNLNFVTSTPIINDNISAITATMSCTSTSTTMFVYHLLMHGVTLE